MLLTRWRFKVKLSWIDSNNKERFQLLTRGGNDTDKYFCRNFMKAVFEDDGYRNIRINNKKLSSLDEANEFLESEGPVLQIRYSN